MELLLLLRRIWRRRLVAGIGLVLAIAAAAAIGSPPSGAAAVARTTVVLDTPTSQLAGVAPNGVSSLPWRASLMTHLMGTDATQRQLAAYMHVPAYEVAVMDASLYVPAIPSTQALAATKAAVPNGAMYVLTVMLPSTSLPLVQLYADAASTAGAARLAQAAVAVLKSQAESSGGRYQSLIPTGGGFRLQQFVVKQTAPVRSQLLAVSSIPQKQIGVALFVLVFWSLGVSVVSRILRRRRPSGIARAHVA
jgi:hypothetical protein